MYHRPPFHLRVGLRRSFAALAGTGLAFLLLGTAMPATPSGAATHHVPLVVYAGQGYDAAIAKAFQETTGIHVKLDTNAASSLVGQIEATRHHPRWGVLWIDSPTSLARLDRQHLLERRLEPRVSWNGLGKAAVPRDRSYVPTGVTLANVELYTSQVVSDPPSSWKQLLQPEWRAAVGMADPSLSGLTYPFIAGMMQHLGGKNGVKAGKNYFAKLHRNGLVVSTTNSTTLEALSSGRIKVALVPSSTAAAAVRAQPTLAVRYLPPATELPSAIAVDAKATKTERSDARQFIAFVLSVQGQQIMQSSTPSGGSDFYPVVSGEEPAVALPALTSVKTQQITPYVWGHRERAITAWFTAHIVGPTGGQTGGRPRSAAIPSQRPRSPPA